MHTSVGGPWRRLAPALAISLLASLLLAGCTTPGPQTPAVPDPDPGFGVATVWLSAPENVDRYEVSKLRAVPRFVSFHAADEATMERLEGDAYITVATGWTGDADGWAEDEWPASAEKDWLRSDIWFQDEVPAGNYSMIRIEFVDSHILVARSQPKLFIGNAQPTTGNMRLSFYPAEGESFVVEDGEELVLGFPTTLVPEGRSAFLIR